MRGTIRLALATFALVLVGPKLADAQRRLDLAEAVATALRHSPDVAAAEHRIRAARALVQYAESSFYPRLSVRETYAATNSPVRAFSMTLAQRALELDADFNDPPTTDNLSTQFIASVSLYRGGADAALTSAARSALDAREHAFEALRHTLVFEVTRAFHSVIEARAMVGDARASVASMEGSLAVARRREAQGSGLRADVLDARVRLAEARENLVVARATLDSSETMLREVLGVGEEERITVAEQPPESAPDAAEEQRVDEVFEPSRRPEWRGARAGVEAAERRLRAASGERLPRIDAFAGYDLDSGDASDFHDSWLAGITLEVDIFDGLRARAKVAEARAELGSARELLRKTELALTAEVARARVNLREAHARLATSGESVAWALESLSITSQRYANGLALFSQVLDAEAALSAARRRRIVAQSAVQVAAAALDRALGRVWWQEP